MTRTVVVLQSNYLPWKGYFDLLQEADLAIFYDDAQYTKNDWRNRNRIRVPGGTAWLTVPVGTAIHRRICDVEIRDPRWQIKHWKTLRQYYAGAPYFHVYETFLRNVYLEQRWRTLSELNQYLIVAIAREFLGIKTTIVDSRQFAVEGQRLDRLLSLLRSTGASHYVTGPAARSYIDEARFAEAGIKLRFKSYEGYPEYPQRSAPFVHAVTIIDLLCNVGTAAPDFIWGWRERASPAE